MLDQDDYYYEQTYLGGELKEFPPISNTSESGEALSEEEQEEMAIKQISQMSTMLSECCNIIYEQTEEIVKKHSSNNYLRDVCRQQLELKNQLVNECDVLKTHHQSLQQRSKELQDEISIISKLHYPPGPATAPAPPSSNDPSATLQGEYFPGQYSEVNTFEQVYDDLESEPDDLNDLNE